MDESRFGTHSKTGRAWRATGIRHRQKVKTGYKNFYLYSAVDPETGENFTLSIPHINTEWMNAYLAELEGWLNGKEAIMFLDGAGWHRSKELKVPKGLCLEILPPYCPELNPVERLWRHIKDNTIKNRAFENLEEIEDTVCNFVAKISQGNIKTICRENRIL